MSPADYRSFGLPSAKGRAVGAEAAIALLRRGGVGEGGLLAYGNGRSYGDSCLNETGLLADMRGLNRILGLDSSTGVIDVEAGVMLSDIIAHAAPQGFFPPVLPGTQFVTVGGAIANDVHGKNHHLRGTFGCHVQSFELLQSNRQTLTCSPRENAGLFAATIGGMGLTGLILSARLRLMPVPSPDVIESVRPFSNLEAYFEMAAAADRDNEYAVAWIDQLASAKDAGRGVLITGNHGPRVGSSAKRGGSLRVPFQPPMTVLNRPFIAAFNAAYRWSKSRSAGSHPAPWQSFFFPLDGVQDWNRLYGPNGLYQHQSVVPFEAAREAVPALLKAARDAGQASFLTVLKRFGSVASPGILSFPRPGYTLTLDFPNGGERTRRVLSDLDRITIDAGGSVNPYKDARMPASVFAASFPRWREIEALRDPAFVSDSWRRTALALPQVERHREAAE